MAKKPHTKKDELNPMVVVNGVKTVYKNLIRAESAYRRLLAENEHDPNYEIVMIYNKYIYLANFETKEYHQ